MISSHRHNHTEGIQHAGGDTDSDVNILNHNSNNPHSCVDRILTHRLWGLLIFIAIIWLMFYCTFKVGHYPQNWIEELMVICSDFVKSNISNNWFSDFIQKGLISGVGSVLAFLPNILILFLFMSFLQETEYLPRAATLMDKYMHGIGLHGSSFIPLLMGFGCNVPAIMATRMIERREDRILTMMMIPYIPCSARMPIFLLFSGIFFHDDQVLVMILLYFGSILIGIIMALLYKLLFFRQKSEDYVIDLPTMKRPSIKRALNIMWSAAWEYLKKIGTVVLLAVILVWALDYFPIKKGDEITRTSYLEQFGHAVEPIMKPLGLDWKMSVSLVTGITAKEFVISTLGVVYQVEEGDDNISLEHRLRQEGGFNKASALSFMIFALLYIPCVATAMTIKRESESWKWAMISIMSTLMVAWICSFFAYQIGLLIF